MDIIDRIEDIFNQMPSEMADKLPWNGLPPRFYLKKKRLNYLHITGHWPNIYILPQLTI